MYITNLTIADEVVSGHSHGQTVETASGYDATTVGVAAGVPSLLLVISLVAHLTRAADRVRQLIESINQLWVSIQSCVKASRADVASEASGSTATPSAAASVPMRNMTDAERIAIRNPSTTAWI